jgi:uncharacterized membrane protein YhiD involved in acid resistance
MNLQELLLLPIRDLNILHFTINLVFGATLAQILAVLYTEYGHSLSNRKMFSRNFMIITLTTFLVINVVKVSLALSLGLIGALSIVRFRAAIKEPEELSYLFLAIAIGLGLGAEQIFATIMTFTFISTVIVLKTKFYSKKDDLSRGVYLTISIQSNEIGLSDIETLLNSHNTTYKLKRLDRFDNQIDMMFLLKLLNDKEIQQIDESINKLNYKYHLTILDHNSKSFTTQ